MQTNNIAEDSLLEMLRGDILASFQTTIMNDGMQWTVATLDALAPCFSQGDTLAEAWVDACHVMLRRPITDAERQRLLTGVAPTPRLRLVYPDGEG